MLPRGHNAEEWMMDWCRDYWYLDNFTTAAGLSFRNFAMMASEGP